MSRQPKKDKVRHLTALLLKDSVKDLEDSLKDADSLNKYKLKNGHDFSGALYAQAPKSKPPAWLDLINQGIDGDLKDLMNQSTAAVLFINRGNRKIVFTFGYGRNLLKPDSFERDFGLKIALNSVDSNSLRSVDVKNYEELSLHTRRQTSRGSKLETFGLNVSQDLLRAVVGTPTDDKFAHTIAGSDGIAFSAPLEFKNLGKKCDELLAAYNSKAYKDKYGFIDHLKSIRDPSMITKLEDELVAHLKKRTFDKMHLAPPEPIDWENAESFTYSTDIDQRHADLDIDDFRNTYPDDDGISIQSLKRNWIGVVYAGQDNSKKEWTVYDSIVLELECDGHLCILSAGDWFEIGKAYAAQIAEKVKEITLSKIQLPNAQPKETEGKYNSRAADTCKFGLMDRKNVRCRDTHSDIEVCDIFTPDRQFIHVKQKTKSATLSHLFSQGIIAGEAFLWDEQFRKEFRDHLVQIDTDKKTRLSDLVTTQKPNAAEYEICFAIITKKNKKWPLSLPFFSQLNLVNAVDRLSRHGYKISIKLIENDG